MPPSARRYQLPSEPNSLLEASMVRPATQGMGDVRMAERQAVEDEQYAFRQKYPGGRVQMPMRDLQAVRARNPRIEFNGATIYSDGPAAKPSGSGVLDRLAGAQNNFAFNRAVMFGHGFNGPGMSGSTVEARGRRAGALLGAVEQEQRDNRLMQMAEADRNAKLQMSRNSVLAAAMSPRASSRSGVRGDTNGDGVLSVEEQLKLTKELADMESDRYGDVDIGPDGKATGQVRPMRPMEARRTNLLLDLLDGGLQETDFQSAGPEADGFQSGAAFPDAGRGRDLAPAPASQAGQGATGSLQPGQAYVERLRKLRTPEAVAAFEMRFGRGSAAQYLH